MTTPIQTTPIQTTPTTPILTPTPEGQPPTIMEIFDEFEGATKLDFDDETVENTKGGRTKKYKKSKKYKTHKKKTKKYKKSKKTKKTNKKTLYRPQFGRLYKYKL